MDKRSRLQRHARLFTFFGVLVVTSGLMVTLFQEARAVDMFFSTSPPTVGAAGAEFILDVVVPDGQRVDFTSFDAFIETPVPPSTAHAGATLTSVWRCAFSDTMDCGVGALTFIAGTGGAGLQTSTRIRLIGFFDGAGAPVSSATAFGYGYLQVDGTGYGFVGGSGYGSVTGPKGPLVGLGYGYGYALPGDSLTIRIGVTVSGAVPIPVGTHFLTVVGNTGSAILGELSSPFTTYTIARGGGGGGVPPEIICGPSEGCPDPLPPPIIKPCPPSDCPGGGSTTGPTPLPGRSGTTALIDLSGLGEALGLGPDTLGMLRLTFGASFSGATYEVRASLAPTAGAIAVPTGFGSFVYLDIHLTGVPPGALFSAKLDFTLSQAQLAGNPPSSVTGMHCNDPCDSLDDWVSLPTTPGVLTAQGHSYTMTLPPSFSPFAITFDREPPKVTDPRPAPGATTSTRPVIAARVTDNRGVASATMVVDGQAVPATFTAGEITYSPLVALTAGPHTVTVNAADLSGLTTAETWGFTSTSACPGDQQKPIITVKSPASGGFTNNVRPLLQADYSDNVGIDASGVTLSLDGTPVARTQFIATQSGITFTPERLADGAHTVRLTVPDTCGNEELQAWTFTVDTVVPEVRAVEPADKGQATERPTIRATYRDALSGVAPASVKLLLDGKVVQAVAGATEVTFVPSAPLSAGEHKARVEMADQAGNTASKDWTFTVSGEGAGFPMGMVILVLVLLLVVGAVGWYFMAGPGKKAKK